MPLFLRQSVSRKFCRGVFSIAMAFWLTLTAFGFSNFGGVTSVAGSSQVSQCSCDIQKRRSNNCCCHPKKSCCQRKTSCCIDGKAAKSQQKESPETPQLNSYCGTSIPVGALPNREPRLNAMKLLLTPLIFTGQTVEILDDMLVGTTTIIDPPPPKV